MSASEFYETGMSLPVSVRKDVALRLLRSAEFDDAFETDSGYWLRPEAAAIYDASKADPSRAIPAEDVRARFEAKLAPKQGETPWSASGPLRPYSQSGSRSPVDQGFSWKHSAPSCARRACR